MYVHTPLITGSDCEGAGEMFRVTTMDLANVPKKEDGSIDYQQDFFGKPTNLTVSGQLNGETYAMAFKNIYTFGPTFRAENSNTTRHAAEFWMIEPEIAFADLKDDMVLAENMIKYIISYVLENAPEEMNFFNQFVDKGLIERLEHVLHSEFGHVTYTEAIKILEKHNDEFDYKVSWGCDLQTEHERYLTEKEFGRPVFVTDYPKEIKAFYMKLNEDGKTVAAMDCLVPGIGEIIGGSQREDNYEVLLQRMQECGLKPEDYQFYLDLRKYGSARHAGFGLGFERCVMYLTGMGNIRDVIPFPRTVKIATCRICSKEGPTKKWGCLTTGAAPFERSENLKWLHIPREGPTKWEDALLLCAAPFEQSENLKWLHIPREGPTKWEDALLLCAAPFEREREFEMAAHRERDPRSGRMPVKKVKKRSCT